MLAPVYSQARGLSKNVPKKETKNLKRWLGWQMWNSDFLSSPPKYLPLSTQLVNAPDSVTFFRMHAFIKNIFHLHLICIVFFLLRCSVSVININLNIYFFLINAQKSTGQILWWSCRPLIANHCNSRRCLCFLLFLPLLCTKNANEPGRSMSKRHGNEAAAGLVFQYLSSVLLVQGLHVPAVSSRYANPNTSYWPP